AIDQVASMPIKDGFRGAVELSPGSFTCGGALNITTSGIVLRGSGSGSGDGGTTIHMVGPKHRAIVIGAERGRPREERLPADDDPAPGVEPAASAPAAEFTAATTKIADAYVPEGTNSFTVASAKGFEVGDTIAIHRPTTAAWVHFMGMDTLKRDGKKQTWIGLNRGGVTDRTITATDGNRITIDLPLADSYDAKFLNPPGTTVTKMKPAARVTRVGVEHLHLQCPPLETSYGRAPYSAIRVGGDDCFVRDVYCEELMSDTVLAGRRITMQNVVCTHTYPNMGASKPTDFSIEGSQILIDRCRITGGNMYFVWSASLYPGPNVILNSTFRGQGSRIQPHMRWSTGLLVDNCTVPDGGIDFMNRGVAGSGHGWTMGWAVAWNCIAKTYVIQNPPGAVNWAIGCIGERVQTARMFDTSPILPDGVFDSHGTPVTPQSLYLAQLSERLGPQALQAIGYSANDASAFPHKTTPPLPEQRAVVDPELGPNLALHRPVNATSAPESLPAISGDRAVDGDDRTYWSPSMDAKHMTLEIDTEGPLDINAISLGEARGFESHVQEYKVEGQVNSDWQLLAQGTTIGDRVVTRFPETTVWKVRLTILKTQGAPGIREFGLYLAK
ncbi:MAG TPA: discoidin domain-containing protein, partial [Tepidisphaeraceae bacterium]|nr:discoidin domain-containing protein [Tepidisphaeraceae bacterium]